MYEDEEYVKRLDEQFHDLVIGWIATHPVGSMLISDHAFNDKQQKVGTCFIIGYETIEKNKYVIYWSSSRSKVEKLTICSRTINVLLNDVLKYEV